ncbi:MAG TPA: bifunctional DNA-formamidopyrimidine glycosylase/DNA-(apurinic or apyrimidinic site) lyase [Solirubrobacteraceae bacterium]|jgi:formamidopyrimidine-DNA glycosylase|nr:bifunctional DNA-formamidopyrimidine glycosylase/DNA-(apurinic or apyrimidinic site) lyase [Solirubrobacteraceae bacterium]
MPELPEVETIRSQLSPLVEGRTLRKMEILDARWSRPLDPEELSSALEGRRVERLGRRGKYLVWSFEGDVHLAQHLRMTGAVLVEPAGGRSGIDPPHTRVRLELGPKLARAARSRDGARPNAGARNTVTGARDRAGLRLAIVDPRRFGTGELLLGAEALDAFFAERLGIEPLDERFTAEELKRLARGRRAPIKSFLLDQRRVAGVGNIYADEALFRAGVHPLRPAGRLSRGQYAALRDGVIEALQAGIDARGATIDDFRDVDGVSGSFQDQFLVHRRAGEPCPRCGREIVKMVVGGRGTYVCETCQSRPRTRRRA